MIHKNQVSTRFIEAYEALQKAGKVADKRDLANHLHISASMVTEITKGRSSVGLSAIQNIVLQFNVSAHWLLTGEGEMLSTPANSALQNATHPSFTELLAMLDQRDQKIEQLSKQLGAAEERIRQFTKEKEKLVSSASSSDIADAG